jgi:hypothetical protein
MSILLRGGNRLESGCGRFSAIRHWNRRNPPINARPATVMPTTPATSTLDKPSATKLGLGERGG